MRELKQIFSRVKLKMQAMAFLLMLGSMCSFAYAQNESIRGVVLDSETGEPVIGAVVSIEGTQIGMMTDIDGVYKIPKQKAGTYTLVVNYVGYEKVSQKVAIEDGKVATANFKLKPTTLLTEVVVTALGIEREEKSLGYAVSKLDTEDITKTVSSNWLGGMAGKVAGMSFDQSSSGPGGSIRVTLRGEGSLSHDKNTALFVVDGVPISDGMSSNSSGSGYSNNDAVIDYGNGASNINPNDIESISVLKGPAATALYGSRAANGAVVITTKSGLKTEGLGVSINSSVTFERAGFFPKFQNEFGSGDVYSGSSQGVPPNRFSHWNVYDENGIKIQPRAWSRTGWGLKFDGLPYYPYSSRDWVNGGWGYEYDEEWNKGALYNPEPYVAKDWYKSFFETGVTFSNNVAISGNNGKGGSFRLSIQDTRNDWIVANSGFETQTIGLSASQEINKIVKLSAKVNYYRKASDNLPISGYNNNSPLYALIWSATSTTPADYRAEYERGMVDWVYDNGQNRGLLINYDSDNPYRSLYENLNTQNRDRVYGNATVDVTLIPKKLTFMLRGGIDLASDFRTQRKPYYTKGNLQGFYREQTISEFESNIDFMFNYKDRFDDFDVTALFGGNSMYQRYRRTTNTAEKLLEKNLYTLQNVDGYVFPNSLKREKGVNGFFGSVSVGWKSMAYLELTGRNDWSSTLPKENRSYFYPSVNFTFLVDEALKFREKASWINLMKFRASWANVGNDTDPYNLYDAYSNSDFTGAYSLPSQIKNPNLKPENVENWEFGLDTRFFKNRIGLDLTYYHATTTDQIIPVPLDWATGASSRIINAGKVTNKGVEITFSASPIATKDWSWDINFNWAKNWNKLVELAPGVDLWQLNSSLTIGSRVFVYAYEGTELGRIYGAGYKRAPEGAYYIDSNGNRVECEGEVIVDPTTGFPVIDTENLQDFGSIYPSWSGGFSQTLRYKNLSMSMSFAFQHGGHAYSVTNFALGYLGKLENSLPGRYDGIVHPGVNVDENGMYSPNETLTTKISTYYGDYVLGRQNVETNVHSTSYLKMKELRLDYAFDKSLLNKWKLRFVKGLSVGAYATNLFCITDWPQYDPDVASLAGGSLKRGVETGGFPMTRTYGFNLRVSF